jgi:hypothetical protein
MRPGTKVFDGYRCYDVLMSRMTDCLSHRQGLCC